MQEASAAASCSTKPDRHRNIFAPFININSIKDETLKQHFKAVAVSLQQQYKQHVPHKHLELECDHVFSEPLDGFGVEGLQLYFKHGECVTWLHDELLWYVPCTYRHHTTQARVQLAVLNFWFILQVLCFELYVERVNRLLIMDRPWIT